MNEQKEKYIAAHLFDKREEDFVHASLDREIAFYDSICAGNIELVREFMEPLCCEGCGVLSEDSLRNLKYHFVVLAAIIARTCINKGMTPEEAYSLSDYYILKVDKSSDEQSIRKAHREMIEDYTDKMRRIRLSGIFSKQVISAVDYIANHLHSRVLLDDAAAELKLSPAYLSRLFKKETGAAFSEYVNRMKTEEASALLLYTERTDTEISSLLGFSSQSYFIKIFRKHYGMTPKEYKKRYKIPVFETGGK